MYFKVIKNNKVIDVLDKLVYLKWEPKIKMMVLCGEDEAQAILSSDKETVWHERTLYKIPVEGFDTVELIDIDEHEYKQLQMLNGRTPEEIADAVILSLIEDGII